MGRSGSPVREQLHALPNEIRRAEQLIRSFIRETPIDYSYPLSRREHASVHLKLEHLQHTGSFKPRGAMYKMLSLSRAEQNHGVIAASSGNHGIAVCYAAKQLGIRATICMPRGAADVKVRLIRDLGGKIVIHGRNTLDAEGRARALAASRGLALVPPYNDLRVIAGQGTLAVELARQMTKVHVVFVAVGGGGLLSGIASYLKWAKPGTRIVGCWPANSRVLYESLAAGRILEFPERPTISDGTAGGVESGSVTLPLCRALLDDAVLVSENEIRRAMRILVEEERWVVEGAAGVALAGFLKKKREYAGKNVVVVLCGRNISAEKAREILSAGR